jgi:hypothetical protein
VSCVGVSCLKFFAPDTPKYVRSDAKMKVRDKNGTCNKGYIICTYVEDLEWNVLVLLPTAVSNECSLLLKKGMQQKKICTLLSQSERLE